MSDLEIRDWIEIIDREIDILTKRLFVMMSKMGSALVILAIVIWFIYTNFIQDRDMDFVLMLLFFIQNLISHTIIIGYIFQSHNYIHTTQRIKSKLPVEKENMESLTTKRKAHSMDILIIFFFILNLWEYFEINNYPFYFALTSLIIFIIGIIFWILLLFSILYSSNINMYQRLKYDILSEKLTDVGIIRDKYLLIGGKPSEVIIMNEKGEFEEF